METQQPSPSLQGLSRAQVERLFFIDFRLYFLGELSRHDVRTRFGTGSAGATRDIALYRELAPKNLVFDGGRKTYLTSPDFRPLFEHTSLKALRAISEGIAESFADTGAELLPCEAPLPLNVPRPGVLAPICRAIHRKHLVRVTYTSMSSGQTSRELIPHALVDTGLRWHVRSFDRKTKTFRDFVLSRMSDVQVLSASDILETETPRYDVQWSRIIELELIPHPAQPRANVIAIDYGMSDGTLKVRARAATVGYLLRRWNIDCTPNHALSGPEYALWLKDSLVLYGAETAMLAPGYRIPISPSTFEISKT